MQNMAGESMCCLSAISIQAFLFRLIRRIRRSIFEASTELIALFFFFSFPCLFMRSFFKVGLWCHSVGVDDSGTTALWKHRRVRDAELPQTRAQNFSARQLS